MKWLKGKKTILGSIAAGLLTCLYAADQLVHDGALVWLEATTYQMLAAAVVTWTGVSLRLAQR